MGSLFAYAAFDHGLSDTAAHWAVKTAESLTWSQFQLLALVGRAEELDLAGIVIGQSAPNWDSFTLHQELNEYLARVVDFTVVTVQTEISTGDHALQKAREECTTTLARAAASLRRDDPPRLMVFE